MSANDRQVGGEHYRRRKYQHWDVTAPYGLFCLLYAATKYCDRFDPHSPNPKLGKEALEKAIHYVEKTIEIFSAPVLEPRVYGGTVPHDLVMDYLIQLDVHPSLSTAIQLMLDWNDLDDLRAAISHLKSAINYYYPNL